jgi:hypothetical protein
MIHVDSRSLPRALTAVVLALLAFACIGTPALAQGPRNDSCAGAIDITDGTIVGSTVTASPDGQASCGLSNQTPDVWYRYHATCTGRLVADTCAGSAPDDTVLSVYVGTCGNLTEVGCNDDACSGYLSSVAVPVQLGYVYYVRVSGFNGATQSFSLHTACMIANDACANATPLYDRFVESGTTVGATVDGSASCGFSNGTPDVWYSYTATQTGLLVVMTGGSALDTVLSVHTACPGTANNQLPQGCNDDDPTDYAAVYPRTPRASLVGVRVEAGLTYYIRLSGWFGSVGEYLIVGWTVPDQDRCADAQELDWRDLIFTYVPIIGSTAFSSPDGSSTCGYSDTTADNWYTFVAPCQGYMTIDTCTSAYDTVLSVHSACPGTYDNQLVSSCSDDACGFSSRLTLTVYRGERYWVRVSGYNGASGLYLFSVRPWPEHSNDDCAGALTTYDGATPVSTCGAYTSEPSAEPCLIGGSELIADLWYRYSATCNGFVTVSVCGSSFESLLAIYDGACPSSAGQAIICDGGSCPEGGARLSFPALRGVSYIIRVAAGPDLENSRGDGELMIQCRPYADLNGDGRVDVRDYLVFLSLFAVADPIVDFTEDGRIDVRDYLRFLAYYASP